MNIRDINSVTNIRAGDPNINKRINSNDTSIQKIFSLKYLILKILLGVVGGIGTWYLSEVINDTETGAVIEASQMVPLLICILLVIVGLLGINDLIKKNLKL